LRQHPAAQQHRDLVRVDSVVLGFAAVERFHIERVAGHDTSVRRRRERAISLCARAALHTASRGR
jgi:hypothetical protein